MVISGAESQGSVHDTLDAWAVAVIQGEAKLESNMGLRYHMREKWCSKSSIEVE